MQPLAQGQKVRGNAPWQKDKEDTLQTHMQGGGGVPREEGCPLMEGKEMFQRNRRGNTVPGSHKSVGEGTEEAAQLAPPTRPGFPDPNSLLYSSMFVVLPTSYAALFHTNTVTVPNSIEVVSP